MNADPKPKRRWMPIVLAVSLALNLLIAGIAVGTVLRLRGEGADKGPPGFGPALYRALPKDDRKAMRRELRGLHGKGASLRLRDFQAMNTALRAIPFDPGAVELLLQQQAQSMADLQSMLQAQWLERITAMSDEDRQTYADRLEEVVERGPHKTRRRH